MRTDIHIASYAKSEYDKDELKREIDRAMDIYLARGGKIEKIVGAGRINEREYFIGLDMDSHIPGGELL